MSIKIEEVFTLSKDGFKDLKIMKLENGEYRMLAHRYGNGDERWADVDKDYVENYLRNPPSDVTRKDLV